MNTPTQINDGGPAFPTRSEGQIGPVSYHFVGMTLRDYFAAKAMQALLALDLEYPNFEGLGEDSYDVADAMLAARESKPQAVNAELLESLKKIAVHVGAVGYPVNASGKYDKNGQWKFDEALPKPADAREIKAAFELIREVVEQLEGGAS